MVGRNLYLQVDMKPPLIPILMVPDCTCAEDMNRNPWYLGLPLPNSRAICIRGSNEEVREARSAKPGQGRACPNGRAYCSGKNLTFLPGERGPYSKGPLIIVGGPVSVQ